ncbi:MAG: ABC transporter ATP-binding protein [bacterium]|nr:ABC transporter ATP-binding protein [bacterium]
MFTLERINKTYTSRRGLVKALDEISLTIEAGELMTITGPSGSGKTTLLLTLGGMIRPSSGSIRFKGEELAFSGSRKLAHFRNRNVGFVLQSFHLVPYLSALQNVMVPMLLANGRKGRTATEQRALGLLDQLGLGDRAEHLPRELSVGQQQRVAIARALVNDPEVILADEPTGNLDPALSREVLGILKALNQQEGRTVIMVTHSPEAATIGRQRLHLVDGRCRH